MTQDRIIGGLDIDTYTDAPLRVRRAALLDAPPRHIFAAISDHANLDRWMALVTQVHVNRGHALVRDGVGTIRYLHFDFFYSLRQYVIASNPPHLLAYSIEQNGFINDHVSVMYVEAERYGGTRLTWSHFFQASTLPFLTEPLLNLAFHLMCGRGLNNLIRYFGGRLC